MDKINIRFEIRPEDTLEEADADLREHIRQAVARATAEGIKANSIVLNSNLVKVPEIFGMNPPMICGLRAYMTTLELPDGYAFSVQDVRMDSKPVTNADRIRLMNTYELAVFLAKTKADVERDELSVVAYSTEHVYDNLVWLHKLVETEEDDDDPDCIWCAPGHEVCGTCARFFGGQAGGCATEPNDEKCAGYVPADHCMKCGRKLRPVDGDDDHAHSGLVEE